MKVMCITQENFSGIPYTPGMSYPEIGEVLTVVRAVDCIHKRTGKELSVYEFQEISNRAFDQRNFAIIPEDNEPDKTEKDRSSMQI